MEKYEVTEVCPHCERENTLTWDPEEDGYTVYCPKCGNKMMLCDACRHAEDNPKGYCDWKESGCWRQLQDEYMSVLESKLKFENAK